MIKVIDAAKYIASKYKAIYGEEISEMKLHKLLYFAQREALIASDTPLFLEIFEGWRFGPVIPSIRHSFNSICNADQIVLDKFSETILNNTLLRYGNKDPWSLSRLSHGEYSWQKSREGVSEYQNSHREILIENIRIDAKRIKERRKMLAELGI